MHLHMFFSPYRIPQGLIKSEVRECINMYPLRKEYDRINNRMNCDSFPVPALLGLDFDFILIPPMGGPSLPHGFASMEPMTRKRFIACMTEFKECYTRGKERYERLLNKLSPTHRKLMISQWTEYGLV